MKKTRKNLLLGIAWLCSCVAAAVAFFFVGYKVAYDRMENAVPGPAPQTFYATITEIQDSHVQVAGLEVNDINFRGDFVFSITGETAIGWRGTALTAADLQAGHRVSITFSGDVLTTYPMQLAGPVNVIQVLDDQV